MAAVGDPDLDDLFKDIGNKLGWFEHNDLADAINKLSILSESKTSRTKKSSNRKENIYGTSKKKSKSIRKLPNGQVKSKLETPSSQTVQTSSKEANVCPTAQNPIPSITSTPIVTKDLPPLEDNFIKTRVSLTDLSSLSGSSEPQGQSFEYGYSLTKPSSRNDIVLATQVSHSVSLSCQSAQSQVSFDNSFGKSDENFLSPTQDILRLSNVENASLHSSQPDDIRSGSDVSSHSQKSIQLQVSLNSCKEETEMSSNHEYVNSLSKVSVSVVPDSASPTDDVTRNSVQLQVSLHEIGDEKINGEDYGNVTGKNSFISPHDSPNTSESQDISCRSMQIQVSLSSDIDSNDLPNSIVESDASAASEVSAAKAATESRVSSESVASFESLCEDEATSPFARPAKQSSKSAKQEPSGGLYRLVERSGHCDLSLGSDDEFVSRNEKMESVLVSCGEDELTGSGKKTKAKGHEVVLKTEVKSTEVVLGSSEDDEDFVTVAETLDDLAEKKSITQSNCQVNFESTGKAIKDSEWYNLSSDSEQELPSLDEEALQHHRVKPRKFTKTGKQTPHSAKKAFDDSDSSDDDFESFLTKMKTPAKQKKPASNESLEDFLVSDSDVEQDDSVFYLSTSNQLSKVNETVPLSQRVGGSLTILKSKGDIKPRLPPKSKSIGVLKTVVNPKPHPEPSIRSTKHSSASAFQYSFIKSLSTNIPEDKRHLEARRFVKSFSVYREELTNKLFKLYNETVFDNQLNSQLEVKWNKRLLKTAGYCAYKRDRSGLYTARIELSDKVCDSAERVRDTLIHEMCHAAVWLINGAKDGHGPLWKYWAKRSTVAHPDLPDIKRCHSYDITTKYTYRCTKCSYQFGRHSKSLDTSKKVCGYCRSTFELLVAKKDGTLTTPRKAPATPNRFALFVKEHYVSVKNSGKGLTHKDVMAVLSDKFALAKIS